MEQLSARQWQALRRLARSVIAKNLLQLQSRIELSDNTVAKSNARRLIATRIRILSDVSQVTTLQNMIVDHMRDGKVLPFTFDKECIDCLAGFESALSHALAEGFDESLQITLGIEEMLTLGLAVAELQ